MAKNRLIDLRNHLFEALEKLKDGEMEAGEACAISKLAQTIINTARLEMDYAEMMGESKLLGDNRLAESGPPALQ